MMKRLWLDERGFVATTDLILIATILVLGTIVGLVALRNQVVQEFGDLSTAVGRLNQSYEYTGCDYQREIEPGVFSEATVAGSDYTDETDACDFEDPPGGSPAGIVLTDGPLDEGEPLSP